MKINKDYIQKNIDTFQLISISTNKVYSFCYENKEYILKIRNVPSDNLSPFWWSLKNIYGSTFWGQGRNMRKLISVLEKNPHMKVPKLIDYNEEMDYLVYEKSDGVSWEADEFHEDVSAYQLGK